MIHLYYTEGKLMIHLYYKEVWKPDFKSGNTEYGRHKKGRQLWLSEDISRRQPEF